MRTIANIISLLFHPLFLIGYMLVILLAINPYIFAIHNHKDLFVMLFSVFMLTIFFPAFSTMMMKFLNLIDSWQMKDKTERIGPLITTGMFYMWLYVNIKDNTSIPTAFTLFVLGSTIALFMSLVINSFTKISLHTVGMGGMVAGFILIKFLYAYDYFFLKTPMGTFSIHTNVILMTIIIAAGMVGTSRLYLKAHDLLDVYGGYLVGIISQIIALRFVLM